MKSTLIRIGHSPDPDDAFLFFGMTQGKVPMDGIEVTHQLEGIEELNHRAVQGELEMTAISLHAYPAVADKYLVMTSGASMGEGYGPIVVAREEIALDKLKGAKVAIPGTLTTASLLFQLAVGKADFKVIPFDQILQAVKSGEVDAGVLIHEGQLTYADKEWGLVKLLDLGVWWDQEQKLPVPLGVNVIRRDLGPELIHQLCEAFSASLQYAFEHREEALRYAAQWGRGLDPERTDKFVGMYVNRWARDCRPDGAKSMQILLDRAYQEKLIAQKTQLEFAT